MFDDYAFRLSDNHLKWVIDSVDRKAKVHSISLLKGGTSSRVYGLSIQGEQGVSELVLRLFDNEEWVLAEPDLALHEAESLKRAARTGIQTPKIVAYDITGTSCKVPTVLMTRLPGIVELSPANMNLWLDGLAETLVQIHSVDVKDFPWSYNPYVDINSLDIPTWTSCPYLWKKAINRIREPRPYTKQCFIHRDYHPANVLWEGHEISGVVDWVNACRGPAGIDVGHCRLNLALLYGTHIADAFLAAYQRHAGTIDFKYDPYWDILSLIEILPGPPQVYSGWTAFGITGLTDEMMIQRADQYIQSLIAD
ncbi:aminoglycoside phosphotransferase family protein [Paenibacillus sp. BSR1-1]|uniref:phosphotransferase family protein n=1 Tax=Paenibacillus sp. BSR1-1 TaxID=3020845 RepID=UPI0025B0AD4C|nr:aminoglycoside phosphotransferase family protein [Paenibacillus sp. BSR1-1]MDN3017315.1 aminoglycoside phosphotransferase family protein [Paenibacillus sp. BSR1-1]